MKVLVACEESQTVCKAFRANGHEAFSCDVQPCSGGHPEWHIQGDVLNVLYYDWDLMIAHPPCTYLSYAGTRHWNNEGRLEKRLEALEFFAALWQAPIDKICIENPRGCASPTIAKYSQIINPYYFGDSFSKPTWLWLKNLPLLQHYKTNNLFHESTHVDKGEFVEFMTAKGTMKKEAKWFREMSPGIERAKTRSKTFPGIANAMAEQWSSTISPTTEVVE